MGRLVKKISYIVCAIFLIAIAVNLFLAPHSIAAGGLTGLSIILEELLNINRATIILLGNILVMLSALVFLGREMFLNTVLGAGLLPFAVRLVPAHMLVADAMLSMIVGSVLFGVAVAVLYANKASSGGTAVPPLIFKKYFGLNTSIGLFLADGIVVLLSLLVFSVDSFFYAVFSIFITSVTMEYMATGVNKKKMVYILSAENERITQEVLTKLNRGVTQVPVIGGYGKTQKQMLMVTLDRKGYQELKEIVSRFDPKAFMITDTVSDVHGEGFSYDSGSV